MFSDFARICYIYIYAYTPMLIFYNKNGNGNVVYDFFIEKRTRLALPHYTPPRLIQYLTQIRV
jgi:hypothetical protein